MNKNNNEEIDKMRLEYKFTDDIINRISKLRALIYEYKQILLSYDEMISFLEYAMNYDEMQLWLMTERLKGVTPTLSEKIRKFFELETDEDILILFDIENNYDQENIDDILKRIYHN